MTLEKAHFQENLGLNQNTKEQLDKIKNDLKQKVDTLKQDGSFSDEDLNSLVDLLDDKTILSPTENELKEHLKKLENLQSQVDFLLALVEVGEEENVEDKNLNSMSKEEQEALAAADSVENTNEGEVKKIENNNESEGVQIMNDIEFNNTVIGFTSNKFFKGILELSKKENIEKEDLNVLIKDLNGYSIKDIKDFIKNDKYDNLKNEKIKFIEEIENKINTLPENEKKEFEITNSINNIETGISDLNAKIRYNEIKYGSQEYILKAKEILNSPRFKNNETIHELFSALTGAAGLSLFGEDVTGETIKENEIYGIVIYLTSILKGEIKSINFLENGETEILNKENLSNEEIIEQEEFMKKLIKNKEDVYLLKLGIKLLTPPEKYEEITKIFYQEINGNDNLNKLPESEDYKIINKNSNFLKNDKLLQEKYNELKNNLTNEKVKKLGGNKNFKEISLKKIKEANINIKDDDLNNIINGFFKENGELNLEFGLQNSFDILKNNEEAFIKITDIMKGISIDKIEQSIENHQQIKEEYLEKEFDVIPDSAKKYFKQNEKGKYQIDEEKFFDGFLNDLNFSKEDINNSGKIFLLKNLSQDKVLKFLENIGITREYNKDLYLSSFKVLYHENELRLEKSKLGQNIPDKIDGKALYEHFSNGGTYESYVKKVQQEKENNQKNSEEKSKTQKNSTETFENLSFGKYNLDISSSALKTDSGKNIPLNQEEINMIQKNPETLKNFINLYETLEKTGLKKIWKYKENIFKSVENTFNLQFDRNDGNYLDERETKILLNSILVSIGEKPVKTDIKIENFTNEIENRNGKQISGTETQVNNLGETAFEKKFIEKFVGRGDLIGFKQSEFENALRQK